MKKADLKAIAAKYFEANKDCKELHVTSDGQAFVNLNAATLHKNTNSTGKKLSMETFTNGVVEITDATKSNGGDEITFPLDEKTVKALKLPELQKMAEDLKIDVKDLDTKAKLADAINALKDKD